jgi:hypothetical protein
MVVPRYSQSSDNRSGDFSFRGRGQAQDVQGQQRGHAQPDCCTVRNPAAGLETSQSPERRSHPDRATTSVAEACPTARHCANAQARQDGDPQGPARGVPRRYSQNLRMHGQRHRTPQSTQEQKQRARRDEASDTCQETKT